MIYKIVAIRDRAIDTFGQPAFTASIGGAIRSFGDEIKRVDENNQLKIPVIQGTMSWEIFFVIGCCNKTTLLMHLAFCVASNGPHFLPLYPASYALSGRNKIGVCARLAPLRR